MAHKRPPLEIQEITESLKESKGQGVGVFFPTSPTKTPDNQDVKHTEKPPVSRSPKEDEGQETRKDVMTSLLQDVNVRDWRDTIEM